MTPLRPLLCLLLAVFVTFFGVAVPVASTAAVATTPVVTESSPAPVEQPAEVLEAPQPEAQEQPAEKPETAPVSQPASPTQEGTPPATPVNMDVPEIPAKFYIPGVPHVRQLRNYCGPATLSMVLGYWGLKTSQQTIGKAIFDRKEQATNGADMLLYARENGFAAYSYNSNIHDMKRRIASGMPVVVQQYFATNDSTYHFRIVVGYNDKERAFVVSDPEENKETKIDYNQFNRLWNDLGNWALLVVPRSRDVFSLELNDRNPVLHMDLATAYYRRGDYMRAEAEARKALALSPGNPEMVSLVSRIRNDRNAGGK